MILDLYKLIIDFLFKFIDLLNKMIQLDKNSVYQIEEKTRNIFFICLSNQLSLSNVNRNIQIFTFLDV